MPPGAARRIASLRSLHANPGAPTARLPNLARNPRSLARKAKSLACNPWPLARKAESLAREPLLPRPQAPEPCAQAAEPCARSSHALRASGRALRARQKAPRAGSGGGVSDILCAGQQSRCRPLDAVTEQYRELVHGCSPVNRGLVPDRLDVAQSQPDQLGGRLVGGEVATGLDHFAQPRIDAFDGVGGVDHPAHLGREGEERHHLRPGAPPGRGDGGVTLAQRAVLEDLQGRFGGLDRKSTRLNSSHVKISYAV